MQFLTKLWSGIESAVALLFQIHSYPPAGNLLNSGKKYVIPSSGHLSQFADNPVCASGIAELRVSAGRTTWLQ